MLRAEATEEVDMNQYDSRTETEIDFATLRAFLPDFRAAMYKTASEPGAGPGELAACARHTARKYGSPLAIRFAERVIQRLALALAREATSLDMILWIEQGTGVRVPFELRMAAWERSFMAMIVGVVGRTMCELDLLRAELCGKFEDLRKSYDEPVVERAA